VTRVLVVGSINLDLVVTVPHLPEPGETVLGSDAVRRPGGKGANQAVGAGRLGAEVTLVGLTGDDPFGREMRDSLRREGLDLTHVGMLEGSASGLALIVVRPDGENTITVASGPNALLAGEWLTTLPALVADTDLLLIQLEVPVSTCLTAAKAARRAGVPVVLNAAPVPAQPDPDLWQLLAEADVLVVNEGEAVRLLEGRGHRPAEDWRGVARGLRDLGPATTVVTLGEDGAVAAAEGLAMAQGGFAVDAVDTTGAGDAFCAGLAVSLAEGLPIADALRLGCAAGALATTSVGAQAALPTRRQVEDFLANPLVAATGGG
jgi:ribokinase